MSDTISTFPYIEPEIRISSHLVRTIQNYKCLGMFKYGSSVYKHKSPSDLDFIVIVPGDSELKEQVKVPNINQKDDFYDVTIYSETSFLMALVDHDITALECFYADKLNVLVPFSYSLSTKLKSFKLNLSTLRTSISCKSSNSYVKAKKKLIIEESYDLEKSIKSLWHSFRILYFGISLAKTGKINFSEANFLFKDILDSYFQYDEWEELHEIWRPKYNELASEFKSVAPKIGSL